MKKEIKTTTTWYAEDVREFCIRHNFYTKGDNKAYDKLLSFVWDKKPTTSNLYKVAQDIMDHTDMGRLDTNGLEVTDFMYLINVECVRTFFTIVD